MMTIGEVFEIAPKSERTLQKHCYRYRGFAFINDQGHPCFYRVLKDGKEVGAIKYYRGRILSCYNLKERVKSTIKKGAK